mmetsp:Transcript_28420/g.25154  ORF Transcript_28420/g.25154 Transcript_28420/m.25154 type:complete len:221 (-) Transcript_28420:5-667(-)
MLKHQNSRKDYERKSKNLNYKLAADSSIGFIGKIKDILSSEEDRNLLLALYNYEEVFKVRVQTPVYEIKYKDLPSPTGNDRITTNSKRTLSILPPNRSINLKISKSEHPSPSRKSENKGRLLNKFKKLTSSAYSLNPSPEPRHVSSTDNSNTVIINGKEVKRLFGSRSNSRVIPKVLCQIYNKLNSQKQKFKDHEKDQELTKEIDIKLKAFENWIVSNFY